MFGQGFDFIGAACVVSTPPPLNPHPLLGLITELRASALPLPVFVGLVYRIAVLYAASRVILALKRGRAGYDPSTRLSEEEPMARIFTLLLNYSRLILVAVYSHLLILDVDGQVFWRWYASFICHLLLLPD